MPDAYVIGAGMIPMGRHRESSYAGLAAPAARAALASAGREPSDIDAVYCGNSFGGMLAGQRIAKEIDLGGIPVLNVDNACSGGASALHEAVAAVRSGRHRTALVLGVDKLTQFNGGTIPLVTEDWEVRRGMVMPALYAMRAQRYLHERPDSSIEDLAAVSVKARTHSAKNPYAQYRTTVTIDEVLASRPIADPLTMLQCCPTGDGAAALVVTAAPDPGRPALKVLASVLHSGRFAAGYRNMIWPEISASSAAEAYAQAGIGPRDLDVVELHDAFTIAELVYYEVLGLCERGESTAFLRDGRSTYGGDVVVNPSGGLLAKGHPIGASGAAQVVELFWQLTGTAGDRQVPNARYGLTHVTGGGISGMDHGACSIHIFEGTS
ncbi:benzoylsuccinyl-CoA thiolase BbsB subunit [Pseudonocardia thermophila]|jgi:Acetyl-CoA acetyltransferase|uniref:propanoyl-CoA C-acyltransferase n=1 Tax=Pseudonocardia thermophila TaxID=1848 RepID=A0A1M6XNM1_PSETH|nr:thiolase family protein [Pseudonocardia thermophila]SHL07554.1 benzoylsuccinyl-CoA thiolase BbsB subunit [Pseudonocardia thermophila]